MTERVNLEATIEAFITRYCGAISNGDAPSPSAKLELQRSENRQKFMRRAEELAAERGLASPSRPIPLKHALPLLQAACVETNLVIQDMWAHLLVNASDANFDVELKRTHIDVLERIDPLEAQILKTVYALPFEEIRHEGAFTEDLPDTAMMAIDDQKDDAALPRQEVEQALVNLQNLGCVRLGRSWGGGDVTSVITPTIFGRQFIELCTI